MITRRWFFYLYIVMVLIPLILVRSKIANWLFLYVSLSSLSSALHATHTLTDFTNFQVPS